jgi:hypothetical protein
MRCVRVVLLIVVCCLTGCTSGRLRQRTINQGSTLPELQYQQVLDNLARFAANPATLPWHVNLREGTTQVTDSVSAGALVDLGPPAITEPQVFGSRTAVGQWGVSPVIDPTELRLLRIAYRRAHGSPEMPGPEFLDELAHELKDQLASNADLRSESETFYEYQWKVHRSAPEFDARVLTTNDDDFCVQAAHHHPGGASPLAKNVCRKIEAIERDLARVRPGWFRVGGKHDVPKCARYVGKCGDRYVWVEPDGLEALTEFTLTVLKFSTLIKETQTLINPGSVKFSPGDRGG